jgi:hypothetical protein
VSRLNIKTKVGVSAVALLLLAGAVTSLDDGPGVVRIPKLEEDERWAIFEANFTPGDKVRDTDWWLIDWGVRGHLKRDPKPDAPFSETLKVRTGDKLWLQVLLFKTPDPGARCAIIVGGKRTGGRVARDVCEASVTVT